LFIPCIVNWFKSSFSTNIFTVLYIMSIHPSMALRSLPGLGLPHKTPPFISIHSSSPPFSYPQQL
jgi:hypothetical protein